MIVAELLLIIKTLKDRQLSGNCITYGVQGIEGNYKEIRDLFISQDYTCREMSADEILYDNIVKNRTTLHQQVFFKMLGFSSVESLDYFENERPDHIVNLNQPIGPELHNRFDMVFDGGTSEHCFNISEVFWNTIRLLKKGGRVVHLVPISGQINHGFYMFSPNLFFELYKENSFTDMEAKVLIIDDRHKAYCFDYSPGTALPNDFYGKSAMLLFTAKKDSDSNELKVPIQECWYHHFSGNQSSAPTMGYFSKLRSKIKRLLQSCPGIYGPIRETYVRIKFALTLKKEYLC